MRHSALPALFVFGCSLLAGFATTQTPPPAPAAPPAAPHIRWERDFDAALQRAAAEKKPLFVAFLMDDEPANDQTVRDHYQDARLTGLLERFVCLVASLGTHAGSEEGCARFPGITCEHHGAIEALARKRWLDGDLVSTPQHLFCDPQGNVLHRKIFLIDKATMARSLLATLEACGVDTTGLQVDFGKNGGLASPADERMRVTTWLADLASRNLEVRERAIRGLAYADDPRALPAVIERLHKKHDDATRLAAISALGVKGNHRAIAHLTPLLTETNAQILAAAATALESIQLPQATPALVAAMKKEKRDRVLGAIVRAAAKTSPGSAEVRTLCVDKVDAASNQLQGSMLVALGRLAPHETIPPALLPLLKSRNQNVRGLTVWALGGQRSPAATKALRQLQQEEKTPEILQLLPLAVRQSLGEKVEGYDTRFWSFFSGS